MAITKNPLIRYKVLDNCFRNTGRKYYIEDLIEACNEVLSETDLDSNGISLRQIRADIAFMKSEAGWNIELGDNKDGKKMFYRYANTSFSINNMPLNEVEIDQLKSAIEILSQFKGMPQFKWVSELMPKLRQGITTKEESEPIMEFEENEYLKKFDFLGPLYNAIYYKKVIKVSYQPFENESPNDIILHPYYLKQYNNRWFLFGYNPEYKKYDWNLALDRMLKITEIRGKYNKNDQIIWKEYFEDFIGVTKPVDTKVESIILHFNSKTGKYIESKPIHGSQIPKWIDKNIFEVKLNLIINYEFERLILSYADAVKVIEPISLAKQIKSRLKKAFISYT
jgi:predicted DNA-binding transcriptional regulator YafY